MAYIGKRVRVRCGLFVEPLYGWEASGNDLQKYVYVDDREMNLCVGYFSNVSANIANKPIPPDCIVMSYVPPSSSPDEIRQIIEDVKNSSSYAEVLKSHAQEQIKRQGEYCSQSYSKVQKMGQAETPSLLCQMTRDESTTMSQAKRSKPE
jgi:hypothetical protein